MANELFDLALETGDSFMDLGTGNIYRFDEYAWWKKMGLPTSGVFITDPDGYIQDLWEDKNVMFYIENKGLKPKWLESEAS